MASKNKDDIISPAHPHTIKKFELIEKYVMAWSQKLCQYKYCDNLVFIDCMSNSGEYVDDNGNAVYGTPVRAAKILRQTAGQYTNKRIFLYFNDYSADKIDHLSKLLPSNTNNFHISLTIQDGNQLLRDFGKKLNKVSRTCYLLIYDPFDADIDWDAIIPFLNSWGEVIINHMVSDPIRAAKQAKKEDVIKKYESTYRSKIEDIIPFGNNRDAYEKRIEEIIRNLRNNNHDYYIAAYPFFNINNAIVYNLIHCTNNITGFNLYKQTAWKTFGGKSSAKTSKVLDGQMAINLEDLSASTYVDESCYNIGNIASYLQECFDGCSGVTLDEMWSKLREHPIFPDKGFNNEIKQELKNNYGAIEKNHKFTFQRRNKN